VLLAAFQNNFLDKKAGYWQVNWSNGNKAIVFLSVEGLETACLVSPISVENQIDKSLFFLFKLFLLLFVSKIGINADVMLTFVFSKV
jgi:hypothetical protein